MVSGYHGSSKFFGQVMGNAFGHSARIDEDQCGLMSANYICQFVINLLPNFVGHHGS